MKITFDLSENLKYIKKVFEPDNNVGFVLREFKIEFKDGAADGFLIYFDGMSSQTFVNRDVLHALITGGGQDSVHGDLRDTVYRRVVALAPLTEQTDMQAVCESVEFGECAIFVHGCDCAFLADSKGWESRGVDSPLTEASLSGPQEAFVESIMTNLALVRKILKTPDLIAEKASVGNTSKTPCAIMYLRGITNKGLVEEVRRRIDGIDVEYIYSSADVEMLIESNTFYPMTHTLKTERPDRAASMIADGKVVVIVQGSPYALVLPTTAGDLIEASEDNYVRVSEANFMRVVRLLGLMISLFLPCTFIAVMLYHHEALPTDLLLAFQASRENVPLPIVIELLLMEFMFELIKEASVRVASPIGSTLGIIGGLILGQAAVDAGLVSPITIIVVSAAGIGLFAAPSLALSRSLAVLRFLYVLAAAAAGVFGITCAALLNAAYLAASTSVGVPFLSPLTPSQGNEALGSFFVKPIWKKEKRPRVLRPQDEIKQPHISRKWK